MHRFDSIPNSSAIPMRCQRETSNQLPIVRVSLLPPAHHRFEFFIICSISVKIIAHVYNDDSSGAVAAAVAAGQQSTLGLICALD